MIDLKEIDEEIERLEHSETTYGNCEKLSVLYTVRNELSVLNQPYNSKIMEYSFMPEPPKSEFYEACKNAPFDEVLKVIDEHMESIKVVYPKEYKKILDKLSSI